jgi:hypothetical protein
MAAALALAGLTMWLSGPAAAVPMREDPKGFEGIPWSAALTESETFALVNSEDRFKEYQLKQKPLTLNGIPVESMKFLTVDGKFGRVVLRYQGKQAHEAMVAFLQSRYGPLDETPGQTMAGVNHQYRWSGPETEINLTYDGKRERGVIFFESSRLASQFSDY